MGFSITFVASKRPPRPVSISTTSELVLDKERNAPSVGEREQILKNEVMPLLVDRMPSVPLFGSVFIHAMADDVKDLYIYPNGIMSAETASIV